MRILGKLAKVRIEGELQLNLDDLHEGLNSLDNHIVRIGEDGSIEYIIDKVCNHAGGKLILKGDKAVCPMHNWMLDLNSLEYDNSHFCKEKLEYENISHNKVRLEISEKTLSNPFLSIKKGAVKVRWLNHACVLVECNGFTLMTDPWLFGPAFLTGWWLAQPSPTESIELLKSVDLIYISHNHPDHLHAETLALVPRDKPIVTANFHSSSSKIMLEKLGFTNVIVKDFYQIVEVADNFQFSILKSGDFRDDSGIYIHANGHEFLFAVDSNFLNSHVLPQNIDLFLYSFAGGASGFPLCYSSFSQEEKSKLIKRSRNSIRAKVIKYIEACKPKYFMPYAGMFAEYAERDSYIHEHNYKIKPEEYISLLSNQETETIIPDSSSTIVFKDGHLKIERKEGIKYLRPEDTDLYITNLKKECTYDVEAIISYLKKSDYHGKQILQIIPTDDHFENITGEIIYADFSLGFFKSIPKTDLKEEHETCRVMQMRVRAEIIMCTVANYLPWEDLLIGFQMRATRSPNTYESDFWYHFTNVYVAKQNFKYSSYCGSCTIIDQNPIWI